MTAHNCLNCQKELTDKYCSGCGQKADTHRISFRHFLFHDLLHGVFHIEKGILFTAKQALRRPGQAAADYISGKRIRYYNVFYLILLTVGLMLFVRHAGGFFEDTQEVASKKVYLNEASRKMDELFIKKSKFILLLFIPFASLNSFILFRRKRWNLSEHAILSGMILLGILLLSTLANLYFYLNNLLGLSGQIASYVVIAILIAYVVFAYFNAFGNLYSRPGVMWRMMAFFLLLALDIYLLFLIVFGFVSDWKFGTVTISPFS